MTPAKTPDATEDLAARNDVAEAPAESESAYAPRAAASDADRESVTGESVAQSPPQPAWIYEVLRYAASFALLTLGGLASWVLWSLREPPPDPPPPAPLPEVNLVEVSAHDDGLDIFVDGVVTPFREVNLFAEVSGRVVEKTAACNAGEFVERGELLLRIDSSEYKLELDRLEKEKEQANLKLAELAAEIANTESLQELAQKELALQEKDLNRLRDLLARGIGTQAGVDAAERTVLVAENAEQRLKNQLRTAEAQRNSLVAAVELVEERMKRAELDLQRTEVRAPIRGVVVQDSVEEDGFVQRGAALAMIEDTSKVEVKCKLKVEDLHWLWSQAEADATAAGDEAAPVSGRGYRIPRTEATVLYRIGSRQFSWKGRLDRYDGIGLDERTRTVPVRIVVDEPRDVRLWSGSELTRDLPGPTALVRGMFVTIRIHAQPKATLFRVPERAVRPGGVVWKCVDAPLGDDATLYASYFAATPVVTLPSPAFAAPVSLALKEITVPRLYEKRVDFVELWRPQDMRATETPARSAAIIYANPDDISAGDEIVISPLPYFRNGMQIRRAGAGEDASPKVESSEAADKDDAMAVREGAAS